MDRTLYVIEWTHDDGMDEHQLFADLTHEEADKVRDLLIRRRAVNAHVYSPATVGCSDARLEIMEDLPL